MKSCENCFNKSGCSHWMTAKKECSRYVSWLAVEAYLDGVLPFTKAPPLKGDLYQN